MKKMQAKLLMVFIALFVTISTSTLASAAQKQLSTAPAPETSTQGVYPFMVLIIEIICPSPLAWPPVV